MNRKRVPLLLKEGVRLLAAMIFIAAFSVISSGCASALGGRGLGSTGEQ